MYYSPCFLLAMAFAHLVLQHPLVPTPFPRLPCSPLPQRLNDRDMENTREGRVVCWGTRRQPLEPYLDRETARTVAMVDGGIGYVLDVQVRREPAWCIARRR